MGEPGTRRPGGRTARTRTAVLLALRQELVECGYANTSVEKIAARAGVAKTTVYRRWKSLAGLVVDLLNELSAQEIPIPCTGALDTDLRALAHQILHAYQDTANRNLVAVLVSAATQDPSAREALTRFWAIRNDRAAQVVDIAIQRGEVPGTADPLEVIRTLGAPFYYRMFITGEAIDDGVADRAAAIAAHVARTGLAP